MKNFLTGTVFFFLLVTIPKQSIGQTNYQIDDQSFLNVVERPDEEFLILQMRLGRHILSEGIIGYIHRGGILLSLEEVAMALEFAISVDLSAGQASGWFLSDSRLFALDISRQEVIIDGQKHSFEPELVELHRDGIYVDASLFRQWFPIDLKYDLPRLFIEVSSREKLPIELRLEREKARQHLGRRAAAAPPRLDSG